MSRRWWSGLAEDTRHAVRLVARYPGASALSALTLALGIGASTTLLSLAYGLMVRPLPWPDADRLMRVSETREGSTRELPGEFLTNETYHAWRDTASTVVAVGGWSGNTLTLGGRQTQERLGVIEATASALDAVGVTPHLGTLFTDGDELQTGAEVALISHGLWLRAFGGDPAIVGQTIELDQDPHRVLGVMPDGFDFPRPSIDLWRPLYVQPVQAPGSDSRSIALLSGIARLAPSVTPAQAAAEAETRAASVPQIGVGMVLFGSDSRTIVKVQDYRTALTGSFEAPLAVLIVGVGLLLVTAVGSLAGVQLARVSSRRRELALRIALGAGSGRVVRQLAIENVVTALAGGAVGLLMSRWLHGLLPVLLPVGLPRLDAVQLDVGITAAALMLSVLTGLAVTLLPARQSRRINLVDALTEDGQAPVGGALRTSVSRMRAVIMVGQVAVAAVLLFGALILGRSFIELVEADRGFEPSSVLTASLPMPSRFFTSARRADVMDAVLDRLRSTPGVTTAAATSVLPLTFTESLRTLSLPSSEAPGGTAEVQIAVRWVTPHYLDALGIRVVEGRGFDAASPSGRDELIVNEAFADAYLRERRVGAVLPVGLVPDSTESEVIGIVANLQPDANERPSPEVYLTYRQRQDGLTSSRPYIVVRTTGDPEALTATLRSVVEQEDASIFVDSVMTMDARVMRSLTRPRLYAVVGGSYALFAVMIAGVGLFGVLSHTVATRRREIGVRTALGATPASVVALVVTQGLGITVAGVAIGLPAVTGLSRFLAALVYGVTPTDLGSLAMVAVLLLVIAALACVLPARRAARIDPLKALKGL
ncbi:MAG: ABC transporter permease [Vicinamibacterales bacterium]|nr:ABC transporter permease [Vicinamibacterales bacterium]MDP7478553.1 ABC transporter permease [Vicinamibacterales bacterium]HJN43354.1 ABC transporter permease [Vicinamibacterales bacterium]